MSLSKTSWLLFVSSMPVEKQRTRYRSCISRNTSWLCMSARPNWLSTGPISGSFRRGMAPAGANPSSVALSIGIPSTIWFLIAWSFWWRFEWASVQAGRISNGSFRSSGLVMKMERLASIFSPPSDVQNLKRVMVVQGVLGLDDCCLLSHKTPHVPSHPPPPSLRQQAPRTLL